VAVGCALIAVFTAVVAVIVVTNRSTSDPAPPAKPGSTLIDRRVDASDVVKLDQTIPNRPWSSAPDGIRVDDADLRKALGLERDDVITSLSGQSLKRDRDVHRALFDLGLMSMTTIYVEIIRDHDPVLLRWKVSGDLREARRASDNPGSGLGTNPYVPPPPPVVPPDPAVDDALVASIKSIDDQHVEVPAATRDQILANPTGAMSRARAVPSVKDGHSHGFKLYAIHPHSVIAALHLQNGDTIIAVNNHDVDLGGSASMDLYNVVKTAKQLVIDIERRGQNVSLTVDIK
jgi:hypothetical protein